MGVMRPRKQGIVLMYHLTHHALPGPRRAATRRPRQPRTPRTRLSLCGLEDRTVPATFVVNATNDEATDTDGKLSLREAVLAANALAGTSDDITFDATVFAAPTTITLTKGALAVTDNLTVAGPAAALLVNA